MLAAPTVPHCSGPAVTQQNSTAAAAPAPIGTPRRIIAWGLWDWASAAFGAVATSFVFSTWLSSSAFVDTALVAAADAEAASGLADGPAAAALDAALAANSSLLGWGLGIAGVLVALLAPLFGMRADRLGHRKLWLAIHSSLVFISILGMFFVVPDQGALEANLLLGVALLAAGTLFFEFASVSYNAMLQQISTRENVGRISAIGWSLGYFGGIVLLLVLLYGFIETDSWFAVPAEDGLDIRFAMLAAAVWFGIFSIPVLVAIPEPPQHHRGKYLAEERERVGIIQRLTWPIGAFFESYPKLWRDLQALRRDERPLLNFLVASIVYRDGLNGVFVFGAVIGAVTFGLGSSEIIMFAVVANVVSGIITLLCGWIDDWVGPKALIITSLVGMIIAAVALFLQRDAGASAFWIWGLVLSAFVGPAQSAGRSFIVRTAAPRRQAEIFGLYATTGRIGSFLSPLAFAGSIAIAGLLGAPGQYWGILGILAVLVAGLVLMIPVKPVVRPLR